MIVSLKTTQRIGRVLARVEQANMRGEAYITDVTLQRYQETLDIYALHEAGHIYWSKRLNGWVSRGSKHAMYAARRRKSGK